MSLRRYTKSVDGTIPVQALLYNDEQLLATQDGLGIYDGAHKSPNHQLGTIHVTTHRLFFISATQRRAHSFALELELVSQTDYYAGLFKSSAKVTLHLAVLAAAAGASQSTSETDEPFASWECEVCGYRNPPGRSPAAARVCGLCGVPRDSIPSSSSSPSPRPATPPLSSSLPASSSVSKLRPVANPEERACPACTFLNHPALRACEMCGTALPIPPSIAASQSAPSSRPASPDPDDEDDDDAARMIKLSFRKGGDKSFYGVLRRSLKTKAWASVARTTSAAASSEQPASGISGILKTVESTAEDRSANMSAAFQDLEALMIKAAEMVRVAADLNERLTAVTPNTSAGTEPEEATFIRSSLAQLGLQITNAPVTQDMIQDERRWLESLARELAAVLQGGSVRDGKGGLMRERGVIALDEAWGGWNRARGVALLPPSTLLQVVPHLPACTTPPIGTRTLPSGLRVLHTPPFAPAAFAARLVGHLSLAGPKTTSEIAAEEGVPLGLASELVAAVESDGEVCRDDGACMIKGGEVEVRWWGNVFHGVVWDGQKEPVENTV